MKSLIIHGHFYQPPRENPWTGELDVEPDAAPYHDWNERIHAECYGPNSAVQAFESGVVNNYASISFDFGPTLFSWLERAHPATYSRIIAADHSSVRRNHGHGNGIAQAYNHAILPLCNERDLQTQIRWGLADFRYRFGRDAEAMWLPETACNDRVIDALIEHQLRFVILAPQQAARVRNPQSENDWTDVSTDTLETGIAYRRFHTKEPTKSIAIFFYDGFLAQHIAFERGLESSDGLAQLIASRPNAMVSIATDGESYGHHHKFGDLALAHLTQTAAPARGLAVTNYGAFLAEHEPAFEVEIDNGPFGEGSSWSCIHGVSRWNRNCGCHTGGEYNWNQEWRGPLRQALDYLRDPAAQAFAATAGDLFLDPWSARDAAIELILNPLQSREGFLARHAPRQLSSADESRALTFLEMQRHALLMYTSCAWFFNDIAGLEPVQILKYACRVIELMNELALPSPRNTFLEILGHARSNRSEFGTGADIYVNQVETRSPFYSTQSRQLTTA